MNIPIFELERVQSIYENTVKYNLTESGFHPFTLKELLSETQLETIQNMVLGYGQTNGLIPTRQAIAALYPNCNEDNVMVCNGTSEANFIACHTLLEKGDEVVMMVPNYMQIWGIVQEMGCTPKAFHLLESDNWQPDLAELKKQVTNKTKMIVICNPNNPTGYTLSKEEMQEIINIADSVGAWIYSDEVYRGAELDGVEIDSFVGLYDRVLVNGGLSKAYALPGLRVGWLTGPKQLIDDAWSYHDYTSITAGILSNKITEWVLQPEMRKRILTRNRNMLNQNLKYTLEWVQSHGDLFHFIPPKAGGMAFMRYHLEMNSTELSDWLRINKSVFILAGDCYGMDNYFRLGIGAEKDYLLAGYKLVDEGLQTLKEMIVA